MPRDRIPVWRKEPRRRKFLRLWAKSKLTLAVVVVPGLAILSFFVREGARDRYNDTVETLNFAETMFTVRAESAALQAQLARTDVNVLNQFEAMGNRASTNGTYTPPGTPEHLLRNIGVVLRLSELYREWLRNIKQLAESVPTHESITESADQLIRMVDKLVWSASNAADAEKKWHDDRTTANYNRKEVALDGMSMMNGNLSDAIKELAQNSVKAARQQKSDAERSSTWASYVSYVLVPLGLLLPLFVKGARASEVE